jgi:predicted HicB family RNase H-like nuclease
MSKLANFDGFSVNIFQDEEGDFLAHLVEMPNVSAFANTPVEAVVELAQAWKGVKESYRRHKQPIPQAPVKRQYSGTFNVRIDKRVHKALAMEAAQVGVSLNALVAQKLAVAVGQDFSPRHSRVRKDYSNKQRVVR